MKGIEKNKSYVGICVLFLSLYVLVNRKFIYILCEVAPGCFTSVIPCVCVLCVIHVLFRPVLASKQQVLIRKSVLSSTSTSARRLSHESVCFY